MHASYIFYALAVIVVLLAIYKRFIATKRWTNLTTVILIVLAGAAVMLGRMDMFQSTPKDAYERAKQLMYEYSFLD